MRSEKGGIQEDERVDGNTKFSSEPAFVQLGLVNEEGGKKTTDTLGLQALSL
jgi:hypothetical protein